MSIHILKLLDKIRAAEYKHRKEVVLSVTEAKDLHQDITKLLLELTELKKPKPNEVIEVVYVGDDFDK